MRAFGEGARAAAAKAGVQAPKLIAVTVLTSLDAAALAAIGLAGSPREAAAPPRGPRAGVGLDGVVCSPEEIAAIRAACGKDFLPRRPRRASRGRWRRAIRSASRPRRTRSARARTSSSWAARSRARPTAAAARARSSRRSRRRASGLAQVFGRRRRVGMAERSASGAPEGSGRNSPERRRRRRAREGRSSESGPSANGLRRRRRTGPSGRARARRRRGSAVGVNVARVAPRPGSACAVGGFR